MKADRFTPESDLSNLPLYSADLAPIPRAERTWSMWNLAALWVGMAVCIPTYLLASYMIKSGLGWVESLIIIFIANVIVTIPMIFNGHAGVKYGIPFPVLGRASFGPLGVHIPSIVRAIVACGWFGIQTWIGGLAIYAIWCALIGSEMEPDLSAGKFVGFGLFWLLNLYFIWKGTESIKWLEIFAAPILLLIGIILIAWATGQAGGFGVVLAQSRQMENPTAQMNAGGADTWQLKLEPLRDRGGKVKAEAFRLLVGDNPPETSPWHDLDPDLPALDSASLPELAALDLSRQPPLKVQFRKGATISGATPVLWQSPVAGTSPARKWALYLFWLTAMVGFWATMSISISDITRFVRTQNEQVAGQLIGLPGTMLMFSFVGVFVTCASLILFDDILIAENAPWDPVSLLAKFKSPVVVIIAQFFMLIATLSTNIAANVIAPANAFANAFPKKIDFRRGGLITGLIGIMICPWWLLDEISNILIFVSGLLGPVLGVLLCDYYLVRSKRLNLADLYKMDGAYGYGSGFNLAALLALIAGVAVALVGYWVPALSWLYKLSWFTGFLAAFTIYRLLMARTAASLKIPT